MVIKKLCCGEGPVVSVTMTKKAKLPAVVGVPEIVPLEAVRVSPGGKEPLVTAQVQGHARGTAVKVAEYDTLTWPFGSGLATIIGAAKTGLLKKEKLTTATSTKTRNSRSAREKTRNTGSLSDR